jgi:hypothetical protein
MVTKIKAAVAVFKRSIIISQFHKYMKLAYYYVLFELADCIQ